MEAIEGCFRRMAQGEVEIAPRRRLRLEDGSLADMAASDPGLGLAGGKLYAASAEARRSSSASSTATSGARRRHRGGPARPAADGAASGVAARYLARAGARTLGVLGCGHQAETQVSCIRAALPTIEQVVAYCRTPERLADLLRAGRRRAGGEPPRRGASRTSSSRSPTRATRCFAASGFAPGALVVAAGANIRAAASSTTPCSSERRSSAATGSSRRGSSRET